MEKDGSKSRSLHRTLLIALVSCLLAVMGICTVVFQMIYRQVSVNVSVYSAAIAGQTVSVSSDAYYRQFLSAQQQYLQDFGNEISLRIDMDGMQFQNSEELRDYLREHALSYFDGLSSSSVLFLYDGETIDSYDIETAGVTDVLLSNAFEVFDRKIAETPGYFRDQSTLREWLNISAKEVLGTYTRDEAGYVIAWDNMSNYTGYQLCFGLLMYDTNSWVHPIRVTADSQTEELLNSMDNLFRKYLYMMIASVLCLLILFLVISVILSKKIADPVVSEHDMLVQVNEMKTTFLSDASHELKTPLAAMSGYAQDAESDLMSGDNRDAVQKKLRRISSEANRMALMVTQSLDATRIEEGRMVLEKAPCDLERLVRKTVETYFAVLNKNNNRLILRIPLELPKIDADQTRL